MTEPNYILAIDQGTTSSRAIVFSVVANEFNPVTSGQQEFDQHYPQPGWVEHEPSAIWSSTLFSCRSALEAFTAQGNDPSQISALGITNQRETTVVWDRNTGEPVYNAIVWQDRRTADRCGALEKSGATDLVRTRTGLVLDPYFSASKIAWILDNVSGARAKAERGELAFGTVDCYLIWLLTNGQVHATDTTNASRTSLFNIHTRQWDTELLKLFNVPSNMMPEVKECAAEFGHVDKKHFGVSLPISGVAGDQQAAAIGQRCFNRGDVKSTYGTGCFMLVNTGEQCVASKNQLLSTIAYSINGQTHYALEGSIFVAGAAIQWLRDGLKLIDSADETEQLARGLADNQGVYLVPAFTGLGAPYWDAEARGALFGLTRSTGAPELARAALESIAYLTNDLLVAVTEEGLPLSAIKVDGGMVANNWFSQFLSDILAEPVFRPAVLETTAVGAAYLAAVTNNLVVHEAQSELAQQASTVTAFSPLMEDELRHHLLEGWREAVNRTLTKSAKGQPC